MGAHVEKRVFMKQPMGGGRFSPSLALSESRSGGGVLPGAGGHGVERDATAVPLIDGLAETGDGGEVAALVGRFRE